MMRGARWAARGAVFCACVAGAVQPMEAQAHRSSDSGGRERVDTTVTLERGGTLSVSIHNGRVNVVGGSGNRVRIQGNADRGELQVRSRATSVSVGLDQLGHSGGNAELDITVPIGTRVVLNGFSAPFSVRGVKGEARVESLSGGITVTDAAGNVNVEAVSGNVAVSNVEGDVFAESVSGSVMLRNIIGNIDTETVSGNITMAVARSRLVRAETVSGNISYDGTFDAAGNYTFSTHAGRLTLALPPSTGATVSLETFSGKVDSDFEVTLETRTARKGHEGRFEFRIGDGRARVAAETFSGDIRIQRGASRDNQE